MWAFLLANSGIFLTSVVLAGLCLLAHRRSDGNPSFRTAAVGFGFVLLGGLVEPVFQIGVRRLSPPSWTELLWLEAGEGLLITVGLGLLFYAIARHGSGSATTTNDLDTPAVTGTFRGDQRPSND